MSEKQSVLGRVTALARTDVTQLIGDSADPERLFLALGRAFSTTIAEAEEALASALATKRLTEHDRAEDQQAADDWGVHAATAAYHAVELRVEGNMSGAAVFEDLARRALEKQLATERSVADSATVVASLASYIDTLREQLDLAKDGLALVDERRAHQLGHLEPEDGRELEQEIVNVLDPDSELQTFEHKLLREDERQTAGVDAASYLDSRFSTPVDPGLRSEVERRLELLRPDEDELVAALAARASAEAERVADEAERVGAEAQRHAGGVEVTVEEVGVEADDEADEGAEDADAVGEGEGEGEGNDGVADRPAGAGDDAAGEVDATDEDATDDDAADADVASSGADVASSESEGTANDGAAAASTEADPAETTPETAPGTPEPVDALADSEPVEPATDTEAVDEDQPDIEPDGAAGSEDAAPEDVAPEDAAPGDAAPEDAAPENAAPGDTAPEDTVPDDTAPEDTAPDDAVPEDAGAREDEGTPTDERSTHDVPSVTPPGGRRRLDVPVDGPDGPPDEGQAPSEPAPGPGPDEPRRPQGFSMSATEGPRVNPLSGLSDTESAYRLARAQEDTRFDLPAFVTEPNDMPRSSIALPANGFNARPEAPSGHRDEDDLPTDEYPAIRFDTFGSTAFREQHVDPEPALPESTQPAPVLPPPAPAPAPAEPSSPDLDGPSSSIDSTDGQGTNERRRRARRYFGEGQGHGLPTASDLAYDSESSPSASGWQQSGTSTGEPATDAQVFPLRPRIRTQDGPPTQG